MAFSDPQSVTLGSAISLPRITTGANNADYKSADGGTTLSILHSRYTRRGEARIKSLVKVTRRKISTDVLTDLKSYIEAPINITIDRPEVGFTEAELLELVTGSSTWLTASTNANAKKILATES